MKCKDDTYIKLVTTREINAHIRSAFKVYGSRRQSYWNNNNDYWNKRRREMTRENRTQESRVMAETMRAERDKYKGDGSLLAIALLSPKIDVQSSTNHQQQG